MWRTVLGEKGYTLDDTMRGESHTGVKQIWRGDLTLEDTME